MSVFYEEFQNSTIIHIPHSSIDIPLYGAYIDTGVLDGIMQVTTDWYAEDIFKVDGVDTVVCDWSRIFCDVERFELDELNSSGHGFYYTKDLNGKVFREEWERDVVLKDYYIPYHKKLTELAQQKEKESGFCFLYDCHTFSNKVPFSPHKKNLPEICIGVNNNDTLGLQKTLDNFFSNDFNVKVNYPYSGALVPKDTTKTKSIMIEINQDLYMEGEWVLQNKVEELNKKINEMFELIFNAC